MTRIWNNNFARILFIALNPSTADANNDDPTIRRCIGFARSWGFGGVVVANLFAYRSTDPAAIAKAANPIGPRNDWWIAKLSRASQLTIAAWGVYGTLFDRDKTVLPRLSNVHHLGLTRDGHPRHPLYLPRNARPIRF